MKRYTVQAVFGAVDGLTVVLGVMLPLLGHPHELILAAVGAGIAEGVGMGAGEWLSDSTGGWRESAAMGVATCAAALVPVIPFAVASGAAAQVPAGVLIVALAGLIAWVRHRADGKRSLPVVLLETYGVLAVVAVCVAVCALALGGA